MAERARSWLCKSAIVWSSNIGDSVHWDAKTLARLGSSDNSSVSYRTLLRLAKSLSSRLRGTIAVAIPEGPFLPIAILAVHLCNAAVLVPVEPNEGIERLKHMINDARPSMILCLPGSDWVKMHQTILQAASSARLVDFLDLLGQSLDDDADDSVVQQDDCNDASIWEILCADDVDKMEGQHKSRISHIVYTSGTTGIPKGCVSSIAALRHYLTVKNEAHDIDSESVVLLASALSFDPCLSDILATFQAKATLAVAPRTTLLRDMASVLSEQQVTHVLCTPTVWSMVPPPPLPCVDDNSRHFASSLRVVALGGEPIPKRVVHAWADRVRLYATYGVTEACVYQTMGLVTRNGGGNDTNERSGICSGQLVGKAFRGLQVRIVAEGDPMLKSLNDGQVGEVVVSGVQIDNVSGYWNKEALTLTRFVISGGKHFYKSGDQGYIRSGDLFITGRIQSQDGMVKVNGIRIELGEIEAALVGDILDPDEPSIVEACMAVARPTDPTDEGSPKLLSAYCVLSQQCLDDLGIGWSDDSRAILVSSSPLLTFLRMQCSATLRAGTSPSAFILIPRIPLSPTGKADRRMLPPLPECISFEQLGEASDDALLKGYGNSGTIVADVITDILNLQPCQQSMLLTTANFSMLGGDSLAATRVVRTLYADHHQVHNSRFLGGSFGSLEGVFSVTNLLRTRTLGEYVDFLDSNGVGRSSGVSDGEHPSRRDHTSPIDQDETREVSLEVQQYECLLEAITIGQTSIAVGLLRAGVDPNAACHGGRLGKVSSRNDRKNLFTSNPLHVACAKGNPLVVRKLLSTGCKFNSPDASGNFPLHMAASGTSDLSNEDGRKQDESNRMECVKMLLNAGVPLSMKDGNKQTVLHAAARAGHSQMLDYLLKQWKLGLDAGRIKHYDSRHKGGKLDWPDKWYRTPVHWAVLNGRADALEVLLRAGCSPDPPRPTNRGASKGTSVHVEKPLEICDRLFNNSDPCWARIRQLLLDLDLSL